MSARIEYARELAFTITLHARDVAEGRAPMDWAEFEAWVFEALVSLALYEDAPEGQAESSTAWTDQLPGDLP